MNTQQLETFIQVAENLNFARAAEVLNMTQSAVSRQIHALEDELGAQLFLRTTRTVTLTSAGLSFLEDAKKVVGTLHAAAAKIHQNTAANIQILTMGCGNEADLNFLSMILKELKSSLPEIHPFLKIIPHRSILSLFSRGTSIFSLDSGMIFHCAAAWFTKSSSVFLFAVHVLNHILILIKKPFSNQSFTQRALSSATKFPQRP